MTLKDVINPYLYAVLARNYLYDKGLKKSEKIEVPVISIGNISVGGTGKTSMVRYLIGELYKDYKIAIISRGYKRKSKGLLVVYTKGEVKVTLEEAGDEPYLLAKYFQKKGINNVVIIVDEIRARGARFAVKNYKVNLILLDDGFQHRAIKRNLDIVLLKKKDIKDSLLPFGRLREPITSLKRADALILSYQDVYPFDFSFKDKPVFKMYRTNWKVCNWLWEVLDKEEFLSKEFIAFSGLGDNRQFMLSIKKLGIKIKKFLSFPDHFSYSKLKFNKNINYLTTLKDWIKLKDKKNVYFLDFDLKIENFNSWFKHKLQTFLDV